MYNYIRCLSAKLQDSSGGSGFADPADPSGLLACKGLAKYLRATRPFPRPIGAFVMSRFLCAWLLSVVCFSSLLAQEKTSNKFIPEGAIAVIVAHPSQLFAEPALALLPFEIASAAGEENAGIDPADVREVRVFLGPPDPEGRGPVVGAVVELKQPVQAADVLAKLEAPVSEGKTPAGHSCLMIEETPPVAVIQESPTRVIAGIPQTVDAMINAKDGGKGLLANIVTRVDNSWQSYSITLIEPIRPMLNQMIAQEIEQMPAQLQTLAQIPDLTRAALLRFNVARSSQMDAILQTNSEQDAEKVQSILADSVKFGMDTALSQLDPDEMGLEGETRDAMIAYIARMTKFVSESVTPTRKGARVQLSYKTNPKLMNKVSAAWFLTSMLMPALGINQEFELEDGF